MELHPKVIQAIEVLERTPGVLARLLGGQPEEWLTCSEGPGTFSPKDVLGHLVFGEMTDWIPRARIILESGEGRSFDPFDRRGFESMNRDQGIDGILAQFAELRVRNLETLRAFELDDARLGLTGRHPELGRVTMSQLLSTWVVHDLGHIAQITRVMAKRYREEVGPWKQYLTILG